MQNNPFKKIIIYCMMLGLIIIASACSNDEKDRQGLQVLDEQVVGLYNDERTDLSDNIEEETVKDIDEQIEKEEKKSFDEENRKLYESIVADYKQARQLFDFEQEVNSLIHQNGEFEETEFWALKDKLVEFESFELFQERHTKNLKKIEKAYKATKHNKKTDRKSTRLNSSHVSISYAVFC